jgi:Icc-related predicted phosphoesterase
MKEIVMTADLHGNLPEIPSADLLIIGGDIFPLSSDHSIVFQRSWLETNFATWAQNLDVGNIVLIAGNHDFLFETSLFGGAEGMSEYWEQRVSPNIIYLQDSMCSFDDGLSIWGTPWSLNFGPWAFMGSEKELSEKYEKIPQDVDIVVSHTPMYGFGDHCLDGKDAGSKSLLTKMNEIQPRLFVCGHIHEGAGFYRYGDTKIINASLLDPYYKVTNLPIKYKFG